MKSFLLRNKSPILKWGQIPDEYYFEGKIPEGYELAICPHWPYVVLDVDVKGDKNGFDVIPFLIELELEKTLNYSTSGEGKHYWIKYTGNKQLKNKATKLGVDLRTKDGYVRWRKDGDIRNYIHLVNESSEELNLFLENLFT